MSGRRKGFTVIERTMEILNNVEENKKTGCWEWKGTKTWNGYGMIRFKHKMTPVHRVLYQILHRTVLKREEFVCHKCDNRICCNPSHLFVGTNMDNMRDMMEKGRKGPSVVKGTRVHTNKLTEEQVRAIRKDPRKYPLISKEYGVRTSTICAIKKRTNWKWLED